MLEGLGAQRLLALLAVSLAIAVLQPGPGRAAESGPDRQQQHRLHGPLAAEQRARGDHLDGRLAAPGLNLVLAAGERLSRIVATRLLGCHYPVKEGRDAATLLEFLNALSPACAEGIEAVAIDMGLAWRRDNDSPVLAAFVELMRKTN